MDDTSRAAIALFDRFTHEGMDRRAFMAELTRIAGGSAAAAALLAGIAPQAAAQPRVASDHPDLRITEETLPAGQGRTIRAYRARERDYMLRGRRSAASRTAYPVVVVVHENRGLNDHIRDVARRLALAGYDAVAPDFLSLDGGATPADEDAARQAIGALDLGRATAAGAAMIAHLQAGTRMRNKWVAVTGFCWGGAMVHRLALAAPESLASAVSFYGPAPDPAEAARLQVPLLVLLAARDERVNRTALPYVAAAQAAGKTVRAITYPDVDHAFHNDTSAARYNQTAAQAAWSEALTFFRQHFRR